MRKHLVGLTLMVVTGAFLGLACGGGGESAETLVAKKASPASLNGDDPAWSKASATVVKTAVIEGSKAPAPVDVTVRALYSATDVWFRFEWADATQSEARVWEFDGTAWKSTGNEDRLGLYWGITPVERFQTRGCAALCHSPEADPIDKWYMITPNTEERADNWHWKAARTNPIGQSDDKYLIGTLTNPKDVESANKGDAKEKGGYADNKAATGTGPGLMLDPAKKASLGGPFILVTEAVTLDASKFKAGDKLPREVLAPWTGSRGDLETKGVWAGGKWVVVIHRKLDTGTDDDVKFIPGKTYPFGLAVFDNIGAVNHTVSQDVYTLKFK